MYNLNDKEITKKEVEELINDLSMFPYDDKDQDKTVNERKKKYKDSLKNNKSLKIADDLIITLTD